MTDHILDHLDRAHDELSALYSVLGKETVQALRTKDTATYDRLMAERDQIKTLMWAIDAYQTATDPNRYE